MVQLTENTLSGNLGYKEVMKDARAPIRTLIATNLAPIARAAGDIQTLVELLHYKFDANVRIAAEEALVEIGRNTETAESVVIPVAAILEDEDANEDVRQSAARVLSRVDSRTDFANSASHVFL